ncbi:transcription factor ILR3-like isoform X2 [Durio zibethinus]|uniref:Transcription factor ILR3-like isoform X2 n=1 Tax=Durio zibethinus TaxID=66656 RepID=A0A6P5ZJV4_DURZI|nr:transcription factor ILR3-like isoform X2 [Durio zibethinus]
MVAPENSNYWSHIDFAHEPFIDDIPVPDGHFSGFSWSVQPINAPSHVVRVRPEAGNASSSKACREKLRRDRLNDKFVELGSILEPGRPPKTDKAAILIDAVRMVTQLRGEAQKLKDSNSSLQERIKELKAEKNELRDEKQRLKAEKEKVEQQLKAMNAQPSFMPPAPVIPAAFAAAQGQASGNKLVPFISYPGVAMWQFMPPAAVDTSQDHVLRPPVA